MELSEDESKRLDSAISAVLTAASDQAPSALWNTRENLLGMRQTSRIEWERLLGDLGRMRHPSGGRLLDVLIDIVEKP